MEISVQTQPDDDVDGEEGAPCKRSQPRMGARQPRSPKLRRGRRIVPRTVWDWRTTVDPEKKTIILVALIDVTGSRCALFYPLDQVVTVHIAIGPYCNQIVSTERYTMRDFDVEDEDVRQSELAEYEQEDRNMSDNAEG